MNAIVIYNFTEDQKPLINKIEFSLSRKYSIFYPKNHQELISLFGIHETILIFYYFSTDPNELSRINQLVITHEKIYICLIATESLANIAWKLNLFHFLSIPVSSNDLINVYRKYLTVTSEQINEILLKHNNEILSIAISDISHIVASGNYSLINLLSGKSILQTKQIGTFDFLVEKNLNFVRPHRSIIINLRTIKQVGNGKIIFKTKNNPKEMIFYTSPALEMKIKKILTVPGN